MSNNKQIFERYISGTCTPYEKQLVEDWLEDLDIHDDGVSEEKINEHLRSLDRKMGYKRQIKIRKIYLRIAQVAAILILTFGISYYYKNIKNGNLSTLVLEDIKAPKSSNALVILENGEEYDLDKLSYGDTIRALGYKITKLSNGELSYININNSEKVFYNTLRTKSGGTAQVVLSDGSRVWLNANSEIKYPILFNSKERHVELIGEGYFEITSSHDVKRTPFYVTGKDLTIRVFGTKFNVNLYRDAPSVALLEGSIGLNTSTKNSQDINELIFNTKLNPNQIFDGNRIYQSKNIERFIDWKEGNFDLNNYRLDELIYKLTNWYGVEFELDENVKHLELFGKITRQKSLNEVLELIAEVVPVKYRINNKTIYITKKSIN